MFCGRIVAVFLAVKKLKHADKKNILLLSLHIFTSESAYVIQKLTIPKEYKGRVDVS